jgi:EpsD family peptidyl-prolyl cis-trans isomerase
VRQQALDRLIDQELLVQKAIALKLDRDPGVEQAIDLSRRQILASAAMHALLASAASPPSRAMVHWFYLEHPQWFALRRRFDCIAFVVSRAALSDGLIHKLDSLHSADQTEGMLTRARIAHKTQPLQIQLERLPLSMQSTLLKMQPGDLMMVPNGASTTMLQLVRSENTPLSEVAARPAIEAFLGRAKHDADLSNTLRTLKQAARIHYVRRFIDNESSSVKSGQFLQIEARNM